MQFDREFVQNYGSEHIFVPGATPVGGVLRTYQERAGQWWWLLVADLQGSYATCSFGSLLPYLAGETAHIVHNIGDCAICSGMDPVLWNDTGTLLERVLMDKAATSRVVSDLPLRELPVIDIQNKKDMDDREYWEPWFASQVRGYTENGVFLGVYVERMRGEEGGMPDF